MVKEKYVACEMPTDGTVDLYITGFNYCKDNSETAKQLDNLLWKFGVETKSVVLDNKKTGKKFAFTNCWN